MKRMVWLLALVMLCGMLTACRETPTVNIGSGDTALTEQTLPTHAVPEGQMSFTALMRVASATMKWSTIADYTHTLIDDTQAQFIVMDANTGNTFTLLVTFDAAADTVLEATAMCGDVSVSVLSDSTEPLRKISVAMNEG